MLEESSTFEHKIHALYFLNHSLFDGFKVAFLDDDVNVGEWHTQISLRNEEHRYFVNFGRITINRGLLFPEKWKTEHIIGLFYVVRERILNFLVDRQFLVLGQVSQNNENTPFLQSGWRSEIFSKISDFDLFSFVSFHHEVVHLRSIEYLPQYGSVATSVFKTKQMDPREANIFNFHNFLV